MSQHPHETAKISRRRFLTLFGGVAAAAALAPTQAAAPVALNQLTWSASSPSSITAVLMGEEIVDGIIEGFDEANVLRIAQQLGVSPLDVINGVDHLTAQNIQAAAALGVFSPEEANEAAAAMVRAGAESADVVSRIIGVEGRLAQVEYSDEMQDDFDFEVMERLDTIEAQLREPGIFDNGVFSA